MVLCYYIKLISWWPSSNHIPVIHLFTAKLPYVCHICPPYPALLSRSLMMRVINFWWPAITLLSCSRWVRPLNERLWCMVIANESKCTLAAWLSYLRRVLMNSTTRSPLVLTILVVFPTSWALYAPSRRFPRLLLVI